MALRILRLNLANDCVETLDALRATVAVLPDTVQCLAVEWVKAVLERFTVNDEIYSLEIT